MNRALVIMWFCAIPNVVIAHGPWPFRCCHNQDCAEIDKKYVQDYGDSVQIILPPGEHPMWPADGRTAYITAIKKQDLEKPVTGEWGLCISPTGKRLCVFPPALGG